MSRWSAADRLRHQHNERARTCVAKSVVRAYPQRGKYRVALFAQKDFKIQNRSVKDIWNVPWGGSQPRAHHPAEKPVSLLRRLVRESGDGDVLDPFSGSGSTLVAAKAEGRQAVGIEMEERYCEIAARRLSQEALQFGDTA